MFKYISKFDKQNPIIRSLLGEIKAANLTHELFKTLINLMLSIKDLEIEQHLVIWKTLSLSQLETANKIPSGNSGGSNSVDGFPLTPSKFLPLPLSFDLNLLYDEPTIFFKKITKQSHKLNKLL